MPILAAELTLHDADNYTPENIRATVEWLDEIKAGMLSGEKYANPVTFRRYFYDETYKGPKTVTHKIGEQRQGYARDPFPPSG